MRARVAALTFALSVLVTGGAAAQVAWESPFLVPPRPVPGYGLFLVEAAAGGLGVLGTWRGRAGQNMGLRVGLAEDSPDDLAVFGGADFSGVLTRASDEFPLDISWVAGAGAGIGDWLLASFPLGVTLGHTFTGDGVRFTPYLVPRVVLDGEFGRPRPPFDDRNRLNLDFALDLGIDMDLRSGLLIRFGGTLSDREALAIGIVF